MINFTELAKKYKYELLLVLILILAAYLRLGYINFPRLPEGDEPSWMSVAAQLAKGEGFTTRWLEHVFLTHQDLPRPDDYRFPGFTIILALSFVIFGISFKVALYTQLVISLLALIMLYLLIQKLFGKTCGILTLLFACVSLYQIHWGSRVYGETLYAFIMYFILYWILLFKGPQTKKVIVLSILFGIAYYFRFNALLMYPVFVFYLLYNYINKKLSLRILLICTGLLLLVILPWLIRNWITFGNPLHVAGNAGLFMDKYADGYNPGFGTYFSRHGLLNIFIIRPFIGAVKFIKQIFEFEHGLIAPFLILSLFSIKQLKKMKDSNLAIGIIAIQVAATLWVSYKSWAGPRYVYFIWPLFYALGANSFLSICNRVNSILLRRAAIIIGMILLLLPVINPHRYYYRLYNVYKKPAQINTSELIEFLKNNLNINDLYVSTGDAATLNFLSGRNCVTIYAKDQIIPLASKYNAKFIVISNKEDAWFSRLIENNNKITIFWQGNYWKAYSNL